MDQQQRLPITDERRIKRGERKLWARELSWAIREQMRTNQPHLRVLCSCRLCDRGYQKEMFVSTVLQHLDPRKGYGRDPKNYGKSKVSSKSNYSIHFNSPSLFSSILVYFFELTLSMYIHSFMRISFDCHNMLLPSVIDLVMKPSTLWLNASPVLVGYILYSIDHVTWKYVIRMIHVTTNNISKFHLICFHV